MAYSFYALISRMKNIDRWSLMRNADRENVQEHSHMVAVIAHALAVIRRDVCGVPCDPDKEAAAALFHDAPEILTGDLPTPVKYHDTELLSAYKRLEKASASKLVDTLPKPMRAEYAALMENESDIVRAADKLAAYIKCLEELKTGNDEFSFAAGQIKGKLDALKMPEVNYFIENFIPAFSMTLDELDFSKGEAE